MVTKRKDNNCDGILSDQEDAATASDLSEYTIAHHQYNGGCAVRICHAISTVKDVQYIISTDEGVQYGTTKTAQGVVGSCIYLGE